MNATRPVCGPRRARPTQNVAHTERGAAIRIAGLRFAYPSPYPEGSPIPALCGIDLRVARGEFVALMGPLGAGKSTVCLALNGAIPHAIDGDFEGQVVVLGQETADVPMGQLAMQVGLVFEDIEAQLFNATVADEIAFGLEAMGLPVPEIEKRIDESLDLVGLRGFRRRSPRMLSGGEQKRLALASVLAMRPRILILDEPTLGLDPRARKNVLAAINRLRLESERGMTVVMATQDAEAVARFADRIIVLRQGKVELIGSPEEVFAQVDQMDRWGIQVPQLARLAHLLRKRTGRKFVFFQLDEACQALADVLDAGSHWTQSRAAKSAHRKRATSPQSDLGFAESGGPGVSRDQISSTRPRDPSIEISHLSHRYPVAEEWALKDVSLEIARGEWLAVIGVNGSGKSTLIKHLNGLLKPTEGVVRVDGQDTHTRQVGELARAVSYLPQNPDQMIFSATVRDEVGYGPRQLRLTGKALDDRVAETLALLGLLPYADHPPAVMSYGLRRQVALACVLAMNTRVLALDEPTVGLHQGAVVRLLDIISRRHREGTTVIMITHDLQWVARYAQRVAVLYQGRLVSWGPLREVLTNVDRLMAVGLEPLPVTALAHMLHWPHPLPLSARALAAGMGRG